MIMDSFHKARFAILRKKIQRNPYLGKDNPDGAYDYKEGIYSLRYRIIKTRSNKESIEWVSQKRRLDGYEKLEEKIKYNFSKFWRYQGWLAFFRPPTVFILLITVLIFYFGFIEKATTKTARLKWIITSLTGVGADQIQYIGDGWIEIAAQRKTAVDGQYEPIRYRVNPFRWFFSPESSWVTRWRGETYGYVTHPVVYNESGDVWIKKEDTWRHGMISGTDIEWDSPQGTGIREGKVTGEEISVQNKRIYIKDK